MDLGLKDRVAIVTGASKGIGFAIAKALSGEGARVIVNARNTQELEQARSEIHQLTGNDVLALAGDVQDPSLPQALTELALKTWGRIDVLVNNAGGPPPKGFLEATEQDWSDALFTNFLSAVRLCRAVAPTMKDASWGRIISIGSTVTLEPSPQMVLSASSRAASTAFMKAIATELAPHGITVNTIATGGVQTDRLVSLFTTIAAKSGANADEAIDNASKSIPIGRFASPDEFARAVLMLVSEPGGYVTGVCLPVDGGLRKGVF